MTIVKRLYTFEKIEKGSPTVFTIAANSLQDAWDVLLALKKTVEGWRWMTSETITE